VLIIGGGPGGYTAAMYAARAGLDTLVVEKQGPGGQMALTHWIENYPGFDEGVDGFELSLRMQSGAQRAGAETQNAEVLQVELEGNPKVVHTTEGILRSRTVVIATGAEPRPLGIPGEREYISRGVHYCASCDGMFYRGKTVVLVGGGNSAAADALQLARYVKKVILVHRRDSLRASRVYHKPLQEAENVEFYWNSAVAQIRQGSILLSPTVRRHQDIHLTSVFQQSLHIAIVAHIGRCVFR
jgi:thioredoxin reductase (NADPH)